MAATATVYNSYKLKLGDGSNINLANGGDTIKVALLTASYTPDIDTHDFYDDVSANEISGTGYTAGGFTLVSKTATSNTTADRSQFDAGDPSWTITASVSPRYAVFYKSTGTAATSPLMFYIDLGETYTIVNGTFTLTLSANGYLTMT